MVFPIVSQFYAQQAKEQADTKVKRERSRSPRAKSKTKPAGDPRANSGSNAKQQPHQGRPTNQAQPGRAKAVYPKVQPKLPGKSCQHLVPPKVAGPQHASSSPQDWPVPGKAAPPAPEYRGHPGPILANNFATPPNPVGVSHYTPQTPPSPRYTLEEWREAAMRLDERALEQAKEQREKKEQQKAAAKAKLYQVQQFPTASEVSQHAM